MKTTDKGLSEFLTCLTKLEPEEFLGIAKMMGVKLIEKSDEDCAPATETPEGNAPDIPGYKVRDAENILEDMATKYLTLERKGRRNLLKLLRTATK